MGDGLDDANRSGHTFRICLRRVIDYNWMEELTMEWIVRLVNDETRFTRFVKRLAYSTGAFGVVVLLLLVNESIKRIY
jgi:hypothetical protein